MEQNAMKDFATIRKIYTKIFNNMFADKNISSSEACFLEVLSEKSFSSQNEVSEVLQCNKAHTSRTLIKLQLKNYVELSRTKTGLNVSITEKGKEIARQSKKMKQNLKTQLFENVSEEDIQVVTRVMDQIFNNAKKLDEKEG